MFELQGGFGLCCWRWSVYRLHGKKDNKHIRKIYAQAWFAIQCWFDHTTLNAFKETSKYSTDAIDLISFLSVYSSVSPSWEWIECLPFNVIKLSILFLNVTEMSAKQFSRIPLQLWVLKILYFEVSRPRRPLSPLGSISRSGGRTS